MCGVFRCFGLFASLTIATNFIFAITGMPSLILLIDSRKRNSMMPFKWTRCTKSFSIAFQNFIVYTLPRMVNNFKITILIGSGCLFAFALYSMIINPGIRLPDNNPLQLLRSAQPFEFVFVKQTGNPSKINRGPKIQPHKMS